MAFCQARRHHAAPAHRRGDVLNSSAPVIELDRLDDQGSMRQDTGARLCAHAGGAGRGRAGTWGTHDGLQCAAPVQVLEDFVIGRRRHEVLPLRAGQLELARVDDDVALRAVLAHDRVAGTVVVLQRGRVGDLRADASSLRSGFVTARSARDGHTMSARPASVWGLGYMCRLQGNCHQSAAHRRLIHERDRDERRRAAVALAQLRDEGQALVLVRRVGQ